MKIFLKSNLRGFYRDKFHLEFEGEKFPRIRGTILQWVTLYFSTLALIASFLISACTSCIFIVHLFWHFVFILIILLPTLICKTKLSPPFL